MDYTLREARPADRDRLLALMPRLAAFERPAHRNPRHLWEGDARLLEAWADGCKPDCLVHIAEAPDATLLGLAITSLRPELLSREPSAHLEAIVVANGAEGRGVASALLAETERAARTRGARSITLHVFGTNRRARAVYRRAGYDEELIRCSKSLE